MLAFIYCTDKNCSLVCLLLTEEQKWHHEWLLWCHFPVCSTCSVPVSLSLELDELREEQSLASRRRCCCQPSSEANTTLHCVARTNAVLWKMAQKYFDTVRHKSDQIQRKHISVCVRQSKRYISSFPSSSHDPAVVLFPWPCREPWTVTAWPWPWARGWGFRPSPPSPSTDTKTPPWYAPSGNTLKA